MWVARRDRPALWPRRRESCPAGFGTAGDEGAGAGVLAAGAGSAPRACASGSDIRLRWDTPYDFVIGAGAGPLPGCAADSVAVGADGWTATAGSAAALGGSMYIRPSLKIKKGDIKPEPYATTMGEFERLLPSFDACIAIGCSLRGEHMRGRLIEFMRDGKVLVAAGPAAAADFWSAVNAPLGTDQSAPWDAFSCAA